MSWRLLLCVLLLGAPLFAATVNRTQVDADATEAYRREDYAGAAANWRQLLETEAEPVAGAERARICYNLGNASARLEEWGDAVGWYTAALRLRPRDADSWANLEHARLEAGLEPADRGDLSSTLRRILGAFTAGESRWLALFGLLPLAICLLGEALRGGRFWRFSSVMAVPLWFLCMMPLLWSLWTATPDPELIIKSGGVSLRAEPRNSATELDRIEAGLVLERRDELPGWIKLRHPDGRDGWIRAGASFSLDR